MCPVNDVLKWVREGGRGERNRECIEVTMSTMHEEWAPRAPLDTWSMRMRDYNLI